MHTDIYAYMYIYPRERLYDGYNMQVATDERMCIYIYTSIYASIDIHQYQYPYIPDCRECP